ncbi:MAG: SAM-dependent chlorinase/fluorinase [Planctomycetes bacterium]|nr:SAM-dependent chlorinase/fluorinase [Planctomycetota bacterium]
MSSNIEFKPNGIIALLTDFGVRDPFVGVMKGVILAHFPHARLIDLTHEIEPQDVQAAAFALQGAWRYFAEGTVFVAVVDPGVGSTRQVVYGIREGRLFIGPNNGILSYVLRADDPTWRLHVDKFSLPDRSFTFHGRDIFAPAAAKLAQGYPPEFAGDALEHLQSIDRPKPKLDRDGSLLGEVVSMDRFGNLITTIAREDLRAFGGSSTDGLVVSIAKRNVGIIRHTYAEGLPGEPLALVNSLGHLEIAVRDGNASKTLSLARGAEIRVHRRS